MDAHRRGCRDGCKCARSSLGPWAATSATSSASRRRPWTCPQHRSLGTEAKLCCGDLRVPAPRKLRCRLRAQGARTAPVAASTSSTLPGMLYRLAAAGMLPSLSHVLGAQLAPMRLATFFAHCGTRSVNIPASVAQAQPTDANWIPLDKNSNKQIRITIMTPERRPQTASS